MINMLVLLAKDRDNLQILAEEEAGEVMRHLLFSYCHPINSLLHLTFIEIVRDHSFASPPSRRHQLKLHLRKRIQQASINHFEVYKQTREISHCIVINTKLSEN
jgi:hypothetical protein